MGDKPIVVIGGGLTGSLVTLAITRRRPDLAVLLIEKSHRFGGEAIPPFFADGMTEAEWELIEPLTVRSWRRYFVATRAGSSAMQSHLAMVIPEQVHAEVVQSINAQGYRLLEEVAKVEDCTVHCRNGDMIEASSIIDSRPLDLRRASHWMTVISRLFKFSETHGLADPILVDATLCPKDWTFLQYIPFDPYCLLIRYVRYGHAPGAADISDTSGFADQGRLLWQQMRCQPLLSRSAPEGGVRGHCGLAVNAALVEPWHPLLPSLVPAAAKIAIRIADALAEDDPDLAKVMAELEDEANLGQEHLRTTIKSLCASPPESQIALEHWLGKTVDPSTGPAWAQVPRSESDHGNPIPGHSTSLTNDC